ncbi:MAG: RNA polymerase sigma factor [Bryobacteraceae bacterium]|nr:RNA polymerase sigma factor [Bryobacteraceae bacterium]
MDSLSQQVLQFGYARLSLLARWGAKDTEQLVASLFAEHREPMFRYLTLITRNPAISEELVQETFLRLHREFNAGVKFDNVRAWLYRVAHHLALDHGKQTKQTGSLSSEILSDSVEERFASETQNPEEMAIDRQRWKLLDEAVSNLPAIQRQCLYLRREGFGYRKIALILDIGETTVVDHLRRAIQRLQKELHVQRPG